MKNTIKLWSNSWLNLAGRVVLIKSILSSYPIFSCEILADTKAFIRSFNMEIRKFLWQGGKTQGRKFNLVNWEAVIENKNNGGLGIRDQGKVNQALGAKLVWRMIEGGKEWWIEAISRKYIKRKKSKILDLPWGVKEHPYGTSSKNLLV